MAGTAEKILQSMLSPKGFCLSSFSNGDVIASQTAAELGGFVAPFALRLLRVEYAMNVTGSSGTITELEVRTEGAAGTLISEVLAPTAGAAIQKGNIRILIPFGEYEENTLFTVTADTAANSVIEEVYLTFFCQAVTGV